MLNIIGSVADGYRSGNIYLPLLGDMSEMRGLMLFRSAILRMRLHFFGMLCMLCLRRQVR